MKTLIVAGGELSSAFLISCMKTDPPDYVIAADRGLDVLAEAGIRPDLVLGDFDSTVLGPGLFAGQGTACEVYPREKDFSDMESAFRAAIERGSTEMMVLGATGGRMDHFLANVMDLRIPLAAGIPARIVDEQNTIRLMDRPFVLRRQETRGKYVSLLPLSETVEHVSLRGFRYEAEDITLQQNCASYGISNEMEADTAEVCFSDGILILVESEDSLTA